MVFPSFFNLSLNLAIRRHDLSHSQLSVLVLLTVESFSLFGCKEYNQSDFVIDHLVVSHVESSPVLLKEGVCYDRCILLAKLC